MKILIGAATVAIPLAVLCTSAHAEQAFTPPPGGVEFLNGMALIKGEMNGKPIERNLTEGRSYLNESAAEGFPLAPFGLCVFFNQNATDIADAVLAHEWCFVAASVGGKPKAQEIAAENVKEIESVVEKISPDSVAKMRENAETALARFCKVNREKQPTPSCSEATLSRGDAQPAVEGPTSPPSAGPRP